MPPTPKKRPPPLFPCPPDSRRLRARRRVLASPEAGAESGVGGLQLPQRALQRRHLALRLCDLTVQLVAAQLELLALLSGLGGGGGRRESMGLGSWGEWALCWVPGVQPIPCNPGLLMSL